MKRTKTYATKIISFSLLSLLLMSSASAQDTTSTYRVSPEQLALAEKNGYFAGVDLGYALIEWDAFLEGEDIKSGKNGGFSFAAKGGYRWNYRVALEYGLQYLPSVDYSEDGKDYTIDEWMSYLSLEIDAPLYKKATAFVQAGLGYHYFDDELTGTDTTIKPYYALGLNYAVNSKWSTDFKCSFFSTDDEVDGHNGYIPTINSFTVGAKYAF